MSFFSRSPKGRRSGSKGKGRAKAKAGSGRSGRKARTAAGTPRWVLPAVLLVVVLVGIGALNWARSRTGRAALLTLGADKHYDEVQAAVGEALAGVLPGFTVGPAVAAADHDWPAPEIGPGALIRCRLVAVDDGASWWEIQTRVAGAVEAAGARVLWGERLAPSRRGRPAAPDEDADLLRLDLGVPGRPTHTLVLARAGATPDLRWGGGPGLSRWREFAGGEGPVVALVIDDWGHAKSRAALDLLDLPVPLTLAVLPDLPYSRYYSLQATDLVLPPGRGVPDGTDPAVEARRERLAAGCPVTVAVAGQTAAWPARRREVMLHLPMQPQGYPETDPGPEAILVGMGTDEITARLDAALGTLAGATGVNNHMGSAATSDEPTMRALMKVLQGRDLLFVDSLTSSRSVAYAEAARAGIPCARNRIFLDYDNENEEAIATNLARLVRSARSAGTALGIGHPHPATAAVLAREIPRLVREGVRFVTVSELLALREAADRVAAAGGD